MRLSGRYATARSANRACHGLFGGVHEGHAPAAPRFRWLPNRYPLTAPALANSR
jgi:hypothetical protein